MRQRLPLPNCGLLCGPLAGLSARPKGLHDFRRCGGNLIGEPAFPKSSLQRTRRWREPDSNHRSRSRERLFWALPIGDGGTKGGAIYRFRSETAMLAWSGCPQPFLRGGTASSNPSSSSGESGANLIFGGESHRQSVSLRNSPPPVLTLRRRQTQDCSYLLSGAGTLGHVP